MTSVYKYIIEARSRIHLNNLSVDTAIWIISRGHGYGHGGGHWCSVWTTWTFIVRVMVKFQARLHGFVINQLYALLFFWLCLLLFFFVFFFLILIIPLS